MISFSFSSITFWGISTQALNGNLVQLNTILLLLEFTNNLWPLFQHLIFTSPRSSSILLPQPLLGLPLRCLHSFTFNGNLVQLKTILLPLDSTDNLLIYPSQQRFSFLLFLMPSLFIFWRLLFQGLHTLLLSKFSWFISSATISLDIFRFLPSIMFPIPEKQLY